VFFVVLLLSFGVGVFVGGPVVSPTVNPTHRRPSLVPEESFCSGQRG
jgi:hypothetical protein